LIHSQIWLNLARDDRHFLYAFVWMIATLATNKMPLKETTDMNQSLQFASSIMSNFLMDHKS
jgi:hypothetical protein